MRKLLKLALVAAIIAVLWFVPRAGQLLIVNRPEKADAIIVAAGSPDPRTEGAVRLMQQGYAPVVLVDAAEDVNVYGRTYAQLAQEYIDRQGLAKQAKVCPIRGDSTRQEASSAVACLAALNVRRVLLVTSDYHTRRAYSIFRHVMPQYTWSVAGVADPYFFGVRWWRNREWAKITFEEWEKTIWWQAVERWKK